MPAQATARPLCGAVAPTASGGATREYLTSLARAVPRELSLGVLFLVLTGLTEGVGLVLLVPVLELAGVGAETGTVGGIQAIVERAFAIAGVRPTLEVVLVAFAVVVGGRSVLLRQQTVLTARMQQRFVLRLREDLFAVIARANWLFLAHSRGSDFTHALTTDMDRVNIGTGQVLVLVSSALTLAIYFVLALAVAPLVTVFVLAAGLLVLGLTRGLTQAVARSGAAISRAGRTIHSLLADLLAGMKLIKSHGLEGAAAARFERAAQSLSDSQIAAAQNVADAKLGFDIGSLAILLVVVYVAVTRFEVAIVELLFVLLLFARVLPRGAQAQQAYQAVASMLPSFSNVVELRRLADATKEIAGGGTAVASGASLKQGLRLEGIGFRYRPETVDPVIVGLDMEIPAGCVTAIVGPSGSGKSTIADLLLGLLLPDEGRVVVDGVPLDAKTLGSWRAGTAYVPQDTFLLHDSIRANLSWGASGATAAEIDEALDAAHASAFVRALPEGLETIVGDRGVRLSGGERQRLALARALLRRPRLLVLDEATSQLDMENERQILADVAALRDRTTIVLITHRIAALGAADLVHLLEDGKVVASGAWEAVARSEQAMRQGLSS